MDAGKLPPAVGFCGAVTVTAALLAACTVRFVKLKEAGVVTPLVEAMTVNVPAWLLAVKPGAVATPLASVTTVAAALSAKLPPGPLAGGGECHLDAGHRVAELVHDRACKGCA